MPLRRFALLWVVQNVSALWIVEQDLWDAVKTRQQIVKHSPKQSGENGIWVRRRARYVLSGLTRWCVAAAFRRATDAAGIARQVKLVAGERNQLYLLLRAAA